MAGNLERRGRKSNGRVDGWLVSNTTQPQVETALAGLGLALLPEEALMPHIDSRRLVRILEDWAHGSTDIVRTARAGASPAGIRNVFEALRNTHLKSHCVRRG
jgi:DNA-binding transcriptional LysR family regulator